MRADRLRQRALGIGLAAVGLTLAIPALASATTFCVGDSTCVGVSVPGVQSALDAANSQPGNDIVQIGANVFSRQHGFTYLGSPSNLVSIRGAGQKQTTLRIPGDPSATEAVLHLEGGSVSDLALQLPKEPASNSNHDDGLDCRDAIALRVTIQAPAGANNVNGIASFGPSKFIAGKISLPSASTSNRGIFATSTMTVRRTSIKADSAAETSGGFLILDQTTLAPGAFGEGVSADGGVVVIRNSLVNLGHHEDAVGIQAANFNPGTTPKTIHADHVTIVGGGAGSVGLQVLATGAVDNGSQKSGATFDNSVISGPETAIERRAQNTATTNPGTSTANVTTRYSNFRASTDVSVNGPHGAGAIKSSHRVTGAPTFIGPVNFRPAAGSILLDSGDPAFSGGVDRDGHPRVVDGDHNGSAITDLGAYERQ